MEKIASRTVAITSISHSICLRRGRSSFTSSKTLLSTKSCRSMFRRVGLQTVCFSTLFLDETFTSPLYQNPIKTKNSPDFHLRSFWFVVKLLSVPAPHKPYGLALHPTEECPIRTRTRPGIGAGLRKT